MTTKMMNMKKNSDIIISPSILSCDFSNIESELKKIEKTNAKWIHLDIMDGHFVPNITFGAPLIKCIRKKTNLFFDAHLMIENPQKYIESFAYVGCDLINFHYEATLDNTKNVIELIRKLNKKVGISIKPKTCVKEIEKYFNDVDMVLIMTVEPGFSGQKFMDFCIPKIEYVRKHAKENILIQVDGGINLETQKQAKYAGANVLVSGDYIFKAPNINIAVNNLL